MHRTWSDEEFIVAVADSRTEVEVLRKLGLAVSGSMYKHVRKHIQRLGISTDHFVKYHNSTKATPLEEILVKDSPYKGSNKRIKDLLVSERGWVEECLLCKIGTKWNGLPLVLQLDHINGDSADNREENLRLLCPNCHSQTDTFAGRKPVDTTFPVDYTEPNKEVV